MDVGAKHKVHVNMICFFYCWQAQPVKLAEHQVNEQLVASTGELQSVVEAVSGHYAGNAMYVHCNKVTALT